MGLYGATDLADGLFDEIHRLKKKIKKLKKKNKKFKNNNKELKLNEFSTSPETTCNPERYPGVYYVEIPGSGRGGDGPTVYTKRR